jgi:RNA polymerase sigma-70 factor (ECF subfamily)
MGDFLPHGITVLTLRGDRIAELTPFLDPELPERFGLPGTLPGSPNGTLG